MGGIGSGGSNRKSAEEHRRRGTFQPVRHAGQGELVAFPLRQESEIPAPPPQLGPAGKKLWRHLWLHFTALTERDTPLVELCCESEDQTRLAYNRYLRNPTPQNAHALFEMKKSLLQVLAMLGMSMRDRKQLAPSKPQSSLDTLKAKVVQLRRAE